MDLKLFTYDNQLRYDGSPDIFLELKNQEYLYNTDTGYAFKNEDSILIEIQHKIFQLVFRYIYKMSRNTEFYDYGNCFLGKYMLCPGSRKELEAQMGNTFVRKIQKYYYSVSGKNKKFYSEICYDLKIKLRLYSWRDRSKTDYHNSCWSISLDLISSEPNLKVQKEFLNNVLDFPKDLNKIIIKYFELEDFAKLNCCGFVYSKIHI